MTLHDRIMSLIPDDITNGGEEFYDGFAEASRKAAQLAKEADELMQKMADLLGQCTFDNNTDTIEADYLVDEYKTCKERNNEQ